MRDAEQRAPVPRSPALLLPVPTAVHADPQAGRLSPSATGQWFRCAGPVMELVHLLSRKVTGSSFPLIDLGRRERLARVLRKETIE
jgi:hypothetical protein